MSTAATPVTYGLDASTARFSVARYQKMIEIGILTSEDKVELLENYVVLKMPLNPPHDGTIDLLKAALPSLVPAGWLLRIKQTIDLRTVSQNPTSPSFGEAHAPILRGIPSPPTPLW